MNNQNNIKRNATILVYRLYGAPIKWTVIKV